jgi:tRNA modification GTPase
VDVSPEVLELLSRVLSGLRKEIDGAGFAERVRTGFEVAIVGAPNVGKSTLLNALAGRDAAITSEVAGTTRDVIEVRMDLGGLPVTVLDTAGLRDTSDRVEAIGVERARERAKSADLRIFLVLPGEEPAFSPSPEDIVVTGKADLTGVSQGAISGATGYGLGDLIDRVKRRLEVQAARSGLAIRERHRVAMVRASDRIETVVRGLKNESLISELAAEELRSAVRALDSLIGRVDVEMLLDDIFSSFCIGK